MPQKTAPILDANGVRLCRTCRQQPVLPRLAKRRDYRCQRCCSAGNLGAWARYRKTDKARATHARYRATPKGIANKIWNQRRRITIASAYHSTAKTPEQAEAINAYIRQRRKAYKEAQRAEAQCHFHETPGRNASGKPSGERSIDCSKLSIVSTSRRTSLAPK